MAARWQRVRISIPGRFGPSDREAIGDDVVEFIRQRSESGKNKNNRTFPKYTDEYVKSLDFKNAGKSRSPVNLTLSGDMLIALDVLSTRKGSVLIGYEKGTEENARADGNIRGTYGQTFSTGKRRDFLGITSGDLGQIIRDHN